MGSGRKENRTREDMQTGLLMRHQATPRQLVEWKKGWKSEWADVDGKRLKGSGPMSQTLGAQVEGKTEKRRKKGERGGKRKRKRGERNGKKRALARGGAFSLGALPMWLLASL